MTKEFSLSDAIELWRLSFGMNEIQSPRLKEIDKILKEFIKQDEYLITLLRLEKISERDFWNKREKLIGDKFK